MRSPGPLSIVALTVAPWSALGALLHGLVLSVAVALPIAVLLQPGPAGAIVLLVAAPLVITPVVYVLLAPGGLKPARAKFSTVVSVGAALVAIFCVGLAWYSLALVSEGGGQPVLVAVLALLGLVAYLVAVGASVEAIMAGADAE